MIGSIVKFLIKFMGNENFLALIYSNSKFFFIFVTICWIKDMHVLYFEYFDRFHAMSVVLHRSW